MLGFLIKINMLNIKAKIKRILNSFSLLYIIYNNLMQYLNYLLFALHYLNF